MRIESKGRCADLERSLLRSYQTAISEWVEYVRTDDLGEAMGMLDVVLGYGLHGFVYDTERCAVRDPLLSDGWIEL